MTDEIKDEKDDEAIKVFKDLLDHVNFLGRQTIRNSHCCIALGYAILGLLSLYLGLLWQDTAIMSAILNFAGIGHLFYSCWYMYKKYK